MIPAFAAAFVILPMAALAASVGSLPAFLALVAAILTTSFGVPTPLPVTVLCFESDSCNLLAAVVVLGALLALVALVATFFA